MVVHRIPIFKGQDIVGAIGMLIFQNVTQLYHILGRVHDLEKRNADSTIVFSELERYHLDKIIGSSTPILLAKKRAQKAATTPATVLITGESGTGKELFAQAIHDMSAYSDGPLVSVNCSAIPEALLESELFGYEEGAFTDARRGGKPGRFEQADNGTIFLDEIGDMPLLMQAKILRVLQERIVERVGGTTKKKINVRIIAATNRDIEAMVKNETFRSDLYYRINIIRLQLPALRERHIDIPELINHFIHRFCLEFGMKQKCISHEAMVLLTAYDWLGNVREVMNICEMLVSLVETDTITPDDLPDDIRQPMTESHDHYPTPHSIETHVIKDVLDQEEKKLLLDTLSMTNGNKAAASRILHIQRSTLYMKLKKHGIDRF
jgi:transcriptional regulator with PAS, ATPase and Fis domain